MKKKNRKNPLARLDKVELIWLFSILKEACRERLEKNLINQELEERLSKRGQIPERVDPRPALKLWEPRYRKLLEVASEAHNLMRSADAEEFMHAMAEQFGEVLDEEPK